MGYTIQNRKKKTKKEPFSYQENPDRPTALIRSIVISPGYFPSLHHIAMNRQYHLTFQ